MFYELDSSITTSQCCEDALRCPSRRQSLSYYLRCQKPESFVTLMDFVDDRASSGQRRSAVPSCNRKSKRKIRCPENPNDAQSYVHSADVRSRPHPPVWILMIERDVQIIATATFLC